MKKILYGICGIANGHTYRQLPIIHFLLKHNCKIVIFAYANSLKICEEKFATNNNIKIIEVGVPFYKGNSSGIDFKQTAVINDNEYFKMNLKAFQEAQDWIGTPDLVISDYEPNSAQYSYAHNSPLITIDQQSKFLNSSIVQPLNGFYYNDETMRLNMFFPKAEKRVVCSFFNFEHDDNILVVSPTVRDEIRDVVNQPSLTKEFIVYLSAQAGFEQSVDNIIETLSLRNEAYHLFIPSNMKIISHHENIKIYLHGDKRFESLLKSCHGIIANAGHTLICEAMYLKIPIYALPLPIYEQQLNAHMISSSSFGIQSNKLETVHLKKFIGELDIFRNNIKKDNTVLMKMSSKNEIENLITGYLNH